MLIQIGNKEGAVRIGHEILIRRIHDQHDAKGLIRDDDQVRALYSAIVDQ